MKALPLIATALFLVALSPLAAEGQQTAEEMFQAGLYQEEVQGDLQQAIETYRDILRRHGENREVAAKAQLHIGLCYELLGVLEAEAAYRRVIEEFSEQTEAVGEARARLAALEAAVEATGSSGMVARRIMEDDGCKISFMKPSPDGKRLAYNDLCVTLGIFLWDPVSGETRQISPEGMHFGVSWSPDGGRIATVELGARTQLKIIDLESGAIEDVSHMAGVEFLPDDWSTDGDHLSGSIRESGTGGRTSMVVSLETGERTTLGSVGPPVLPRAVFSPDGRFVAFSDRSGDNVDLFVQHLNTGERSQVTSTPESEWGVVWSPDGDALVYHNSSGTWGLPMADGRPSGDPRLLSGVPYGMNQALNSWISAGYYYVSQNTSTNAVRIPVDPETAEPLGPPEPLPETLPALDWNTRFAWAPDMERIASTGGEEPHRIHISRGQSVNSIHIGDEGSIWSLWWSGDGSEVFFVRSASLSEGRKRTVHALNPMTGEIRELFPGIEGISHVHVSANAERMTFLRRWDPRPEDALTGVDELVVSPLGDAERGQVLAVSSSTDGYLSTQVTQPAFSPDGTQIMFIRLHQVGEGYGAEDLERSLWVVPADGSGPARQLHRSPGISMAYWDPASRWLLFPDLESLTDPEGDAALRVVDVETGEMHSVLDKGTLESLGITGAAPKGWSPDGRWIGMTETRGAFEFWVMPNPMIRDPGSGGGR